MGVDNTSADNPRRFEEAYKTSVRKVAEGNGTGTTGANQFYGLGDIEPYSMERNAFDNPPFLWPKNKVRTINGEFEIQRGYMRSLVSDPAVTPTMNNRRLFFQFNPQVLVRSVQQVPGMMNPLLQDPAQLMQPVPGTSSFGFELRFNREHEVNAGYNDPNTEWLMIPGAEGSGTRKALVSEIGVLADLLVLDTITGQGLSQDLVETLIKSTQAQVTSVNEAIADDKSKAEKAGIDTKTADYQPVDVPDADLMRSVFEANLGNSAFLNPLPFRVMFSSLFMVEGVATSVDVVFEKFSRTMVPTQCKVTINMYALYIGFAKKKTFLLDNLTQAAEEQTKDKQTDIQTKQIIINGFKQANGTLHGASTVNTEISSRYPYFSVNNIEITDALKQSLSYKTLTEGNFSFFLEYHFSTLNTYKPTEDELKSNRVALLEGSKDKFNVYGTKNVDRLYPVFNEGTIFTDKVVTYPTPSVSYRWISYRIVAIISGVGASGNTVEHEFPFTTVYGVEWATNDAKVNLIDTTNKSSYTNTIPRDANGNPLNSTRAASEL